MSIYRPQNLRFAKLDSVKEERAYLQNVYNDIINAYGVDVTYFRRDTSHLDKEAEEELIYGYKTDAKYTKYTNLRTYIEYNDYNFILNNEGFVPSDKLILYFSINEFAVSFVEDEGRFRSFAVDEVSGYSIIRNGFITVPFSSEVYYGNAKIQIERGASKQDVQTEIVDASEPCYSVAYNPYIYRSFATKYRNGYYSANVIADYDATKGNRVWYKIHGDVLYSDFMSDERTFTEIHPNPGDIVEVDFHTNDMVKEQYEITEVISRKPTQSDSISPLVGKYVYKCAAVRRISQHEADVPPEEKSSDMHNKIMDYSQKRSGAIDEKNYDWTSPSGDYSSNVYGGYARGNAFNKDNSGLMNLVANVDDIFDYDQVREEWSTKVVEGNYVICDFTDGTHLFTNGLNLFWGEEFDGSKQLTSIPLSSTSMSAITEIPEMMYLKVIDSKLVFNTCDMYANRILASFSTPIVDSIQEGFEYLDGFGFKDVGYVSNKGFYVFKNSKVAINSFNKKKLVAFAENGGEPILIAER